MRGRPWLELIVFVLVWAALAVPLWRLTGGEHADDDDYGRGEGSAGKTVQAWAELRFAHAPEAVTLAVGTNVLWGLTAPMPLRVDTDLALPLADGHVAVAVGVTWPRAVTASVVELTLEPEGLPGQTRHAWGAGTLSDTWEFQWTR